MLKSDAEHIVRRAMEETGAEFTDEQIRAMAIIAMKVAGRLVEEATAAWRRGAPGSKPSFFSE